MKEILIHLKENANVSLQRGRECIVRRRMLKKAGRFIRNLGVFERLGLENPDEQALFKIYLARCLLVKQNQLNPPELNSTHRIQIAVIESLRQEAQGKVEALQAVRGPSSIAESPYRIGFLAGLLSGAYYRHTTPGYTDFPALEKDIDNIAHQHVFQSATVE